MTLNDFIERLNWLTRDVNGDTEIESIRPLVRMIEMRFSNGVDYYFSNSTIRKSWYEDVMIKKLYWSNNANIK